MCLVFAHAEVRAGELAVGRRRVAHGAADEVAEDVAHADGGEAHSEASQASADELGGSRVHVCLS